MEKVNVLIASRMDLYSGFLKDITSVSPRVVVKDGVRQFETANLSGKKGTKVYLPQKELNTLKKAEEDLDSLLAEVEVIFGKFTPSQDMLKRASNLKWVHLPGIGVEGFMSSDFQKANVALTNSRGVPSVPIAEHVLMLILMLARNAQYLVVNKERKLWNRLTALELREKTVGLIGSGSVGSEIAQLARGVGMKVMAYDPYVTSGTLESLGIQPSSMDSLLRQSDFISLHIPLTPETKNLIGYEQFKRMKSTSFIINTSRGGCIDEMALIQALKDGLIAGAGLDVFEKEPLPLDNELWMLPNVIISSHMAAASDRRPYRIVAMFCENLRRYLNKEPLLNVISKDRGY
jgi:D-2-hydroxyacid dehydrogenase (NADP+)